MTSVAEMKEKLWLSKVQICNFDSLFVLLVFNFSRTRISKELVDLCEVSSNIWFAMGIEGERSFDT